MWLRGIVPPSSIGGKKGGRDEERKRGKEGGRDEGRKEGWEGWVLN